MGVSMAKPWRWGGRLLVILGGVSCSGRTADVSPPAAPPGPAPRVEAGFYSAPQAARGAEVFVDICEECHSISEFRGAEFEWSWRRQTAWALFNDISFNMPEDLPGSLEPAAYADIVAYILSLNDYVAGDTELTATRESLSIIPLGPGADKSRAPP